LARNSDNRRRSSMAMVRLASIRLMVRKLCNFECVVFGQTLS
jgi:hypothetical protein